MKTSEQDQDLNVVADILEPVVDTAAQTTQPRALPVEQIVSILGVDVTDVSKGRAIELLKLMIDSNDDRTRNVLFVNAHTLNQAAADSRYRDLLGTADYVFGDGTGVRWAARLQGIRLRDNLVGTDLVPELFRTTAGHGYRYFMLGSDEETNYRAAQYAAANFNGWTQAGHHHGYIEDEAQTRQIIQTINEAKPHVLLVGMGNPLQEQWIHKHQQELKVPLCMGIGGLFDYWSGNVSRAPRWLCQCGYEWVWRLFQQPRDKASRYLLGNPLFLWRIFLDKCMHYAKSR
jgi:N-acetylglucosaminyldiphosphoundecaprenol N-acetyl-beta-D-mannosaminyltransferase